MAAKLHKMVCYQCAAFFFVVISGFLSAEPEGVQIAPPAADPLIQEIQSGDGKADNHIKSLLARKRQCAETKTQFLVPEFSTLVSNIQCDINSWLVYGKLNSLELGEMQWLNGKVYDLCQQGYPYEETVYTTARYTLMITLLHQARYPGLIQGKGYNGSSDYISTLFKPCSFQRYRGDPGVSLYDIKGGDFFSNSGYYASLSHDGINDEAPDNLIKDMANLPNWLADSEIMLYPEHDELSKKDFFQCFPFPFYMLGVARGPILEADGFPMSPAAFFGHDLFHTKHMINGREDEISHCTGMPPVNAGSCRITRVAFSTSKRCIIRNKCAAIFPFLFGQDLEYLVDALFFGTHEMDPRRPIKKESFYCPLYELYNVLDCHFSRGYIYMWKFMDWTDKNCTENDFLVFESAKHHAEIFLTQEREAIEKEIEANPYWQKLYQTLAEKNLLIQELEAIEKEIETNPYGQKLYQTLAGKNLFSEGANFKSKRVESNDKCWAELIKDVSLFNVFVQELQKKQSQVFIDVGKSPEFFIEDLQHRVVR